VGWLLVGVALKDGDYSIAKIKHMKHVRNNISNKIIE
jgi:hypothetical protein